MSTLLNSMINFYMATPVDKFIMVFLAWLVWPGMMFIVGFVGESRIICISKAQSKAFLPGDLAFGVIFVAIIGLYQPGELFNYAMFWSIFLPVVYAAWCFRKRDVMSYPPRSRVSPTKITHDIFGYFLMPMILLTIGITKIIDMLAKYWRFGPDWLFEDWRNYVVIILVVLFYAVCVKYDNKHPPTEEQILARHPDNWHPIWK